MSVGVTWTQKRSGDVDVSVVRSVSLEFEKYTPWNPFLKFEKVVRRVDRSHECTEGPETVQGLGRT